MRSTAAILLISFLGGSTALAEDLVIPVEYQGRQIQIAAWLDKPPGAGPFPVVILLHGCGGMNSLNSIPYWSRLLQSQGYATLGPDSFTGRGVSEVCANNVVTPPDRVQEVFEAAYLLAARPDIRRDRIAVLGESHGGGTAVYVARDHEELRPWRERLAARGGRLVASVGLYASRCGNPDRYPVIVPLLEISGGKDDWAPAAPCVALANAQANGIMQIEVYPEAYHAFDDPTLKPYEKLGHHLEYNAAAAQDAQVRITTFLHRYLQ